MKTTKRIVSAVLCVLMIGSVLPLTAFAAYENIHTNTGNQIEDLIAVANTQQGYKEGNSSSQLGGTTAGSGNYTKYGAWYGINPGAWCAMFVSWCANQAGIPSSIIPKHASCDIGMNWFKNNGKWQWAKWLGGTYTPKRGDIIYFGDNPNNLSDSTHVAIVTGADSSKVYTIEGNKGNVCKTYSYSLSDDYIFGYGLPAYTNTSGGSSSAAYSPGTYKVTATSLNMRSTAGTDGSIVQTLSNGDQITVTAVANTKWGYCTYNGKSGWVSLAYCQLVSEANNYYTLTLDPNGGIQTTGQSSYSIQPGTAYRAVMGNTLPQATRSGYDFGGWYNAKYNYTLSLDDVFSVTENVIFKAQWTAKLGYYTITTNSDPLNIREGAGSSETKIGEVPRGTKVNITSVYGDWGYITYNGVTGWISLAYCTYYGPYTETVTTYTLTFDPDGGTMPTGISLTYKFKPDQRFIDVIGVFPVPTKSGHEFAGWKNLLTGTNDLWTDGWGTQPYTYGTNITIKAQWTTATHTHSYTSSITQAATCTSAGIRTYSCSCGHSYTESIAKTGHTYSSAVTTQPSCTAAGVRTYACSKCGNSYTESIAQLTHTYSLNGLAVQCIYCGLGYNGFYVKDSQQYYCVNGVIKTGIISIEGSYYYAGTNGAIVKGGVVNVTQAQKNGYLSDCGDSFYSFDSDGKLIGTGFVTYNGVTRYYSGTQLVKGFTRIGTDYYYFDDTTGNMATNTNKTVDSNSYNVIPGTYFFLPSGKMYIEALSNFNIINENGVYYLYRNGELAQPGLYPDGSGDYYYVKGDGTLACNEKIFTYYSTDLPRSYREFRTDCKMVKDGWLELDDGRTYYFINAVHASGFTKIGNYYYFFMENSGEMVKGKSMAVGYNDYGIAQGSHYFGADGKMDMASAYARSINIFEADGVESAAVSFATESNDAAIVETAVSYTVAALAVTPNDDEED